MKTTLDIQDELLARAKAAAAQQRITLTRMVEEGLRLRLRPGRTPARRSRPAIPFSTRKGGLLPGIDPRSNRSLYDALDDY